MDDRQIKKPNTLFPKMFKTFTLYIFATLLVFFGYVQIFGDVKPQILQLPTDSTDADDDTYFSSFVQNMMAFENIDTDVSLSFSNADNSINLALTGNVVYAESGISLDVDLNYNGQNFDVQAIYNNSNLFLTIDESTYKFDTTSVSGFGGGEFDLSKLMQFVTEVLNIDLSFMDEIGEFLGIDLKNFNPNDLLSILKVDEKMLDDGGYNFKIKLGSSIEASLICDEKFNIVSAQTNNILIKNNALKVSADVHKMNGTDVKTGEEASFDVSYEETGNEIDLTGVAEYADFAKNLYQNNQFVQTSMTVKLEEKEYAANLLVDTSNGTKLKLVTNIEGVDVEIVYANAEIFLNVENLKLRFAIEDVNEWKETIDEILLQHIGKDLSQVLKELLSRFVEIDEEELDFNELLKQILGTAISGSEQLTSYLPNMSEYEDSAYTISWENGLSVKLTQKDEMLESVSIDHSKFHFDADFEVAQSGVEVSGEYLDLIKAKYLLEYVNSGIFEFDFALSYNDWNVCGEGSKGTFKFYNGEIEIVCQDICSEQFSIRLHTDEISGQQTAYIAYGNMKLKAPILQGSASSNEGIDIFEQLDNLTSGYFGFKLDFGVFAELLSMLETYSLQDFVDNLIVDMSNNPNEIYFSIFKKQQVLTSEILKAKITFEEDLLHSISLDVYGTIEAQIEIIHTQTSTIGQFDESEYQDYSENFVDGVLDSLQVEENVFAFASDIAIRYSNNNFYGNLTAMVVRSEKEDENGIVKDVYTPAISLHTTSLGLSTYIYLIDRTLYVDIDGLQIKADLNETTITEIMDFVQENFGQFLSKQNTIVENGEGVDESDNENAQPIAPAAEAFKVIIPALDRIYGKWVSYLADGKTINGIQIELGNFVAREDIVSIEKVYNAETEEYDEIEHFSNDVADYGGQSNVLMYSKDSWFYNILLQTYIQNLNNTIVPTKIVLGANIHDPNTTLYADYTDFLLSCEEAATSNLNFAVYLTNISVGEFVENLNSTFISTMSGYQNITAVKSNVSDLSYDLNHVTDSTEEAELIVTDLEDFNSYKTLLGITETIYNYAMGMEYQINISGSIANSTSTTTLGGDVAVQVKDLPTGSVNKTGIVLFDGKELNVQANLDVKQGATAEKIDVRHLIDLFYESNGDGIYATYQHSDYSDGIDLTDNIESGNAFRAKVANANLSEIISMVLAFANVNLGEKLTNSLNLPANLTDFRFIQDLLGMNRHTDVSGTVSKVDGMLSSVENITRMIKQVSMSTSEDLTTTLTIKLDLDANDKDLAGQNIACIRVIFNGAQIEEKVTYSLAQIQLENVVLGENAINMQITFGQFDEETLFNYDTTQQHIDFSDVSSFVDMAVNTINTQGFQFSGEMTLSLIGIDAIKSYLDLEINLSNEGDVTAHVEVRTDAFLGATWGGANQKFTTWETFNKRVATLDFADGQLKLIQKTYQSRDRVKTLFDKTYVGNEILNNIVEIFAETLGLTDLAYNVMRDQISKIEAHPTLERAILGYRKEVSDADVDRYVLSLAGENVTGMSGFKDFDLNITTSAPYQFNHNGITKQVKFLQAISTFIDIAGAVKIDLNLNSVTDKGDLYRPEANEVTYDFHTNEYYRQRYINHVHDIQFREHGGENVQDIEGVVVGDAITLPTLANKVTYEQDARTKTTWEFDGWWTTSTYEKGTKFLENTAPDKNLVLHAKWKVLKIEHIYVVNMYHNGEVVKTFNLMEGETLSTADFGGLEGISDHGAEFFYMNDNSVFTALTAHEDVDLYFRNYYQITFDVLDDSVSLNASPWKDSAKLIYNDSETSQMTYNFLEGDVDLSNISAECKYKFLGVYYWYNFQGWKGANENGVYNLTGDATIEVSFSSLKSSTKGYYS